MAGINFIENEQYLPKLKFRNKMTKEEIRNKWIRHTPLIKLDECVDNAMQEFADLQTKELKDKNEDLLNAIEFLTSGINHLSQGFEIGAALNIDRATKLLQKYK